MAKFYFKKALVMPIAFILHKTLFCVSVMEKANSAQYKKIFAGLNKVHFYSSCGQQLQAISLDP